MLLGKGNARATPLQRENAAPTTRAFYSSREEYPTRCLVQIIDKGDDGSGNTPLDIVCATTSNSGSTWSLSAHLFPTKTYDFYFWADNAASDNSAGDAQVTDFEAIPYIPGTVAMSGRITDWNYSTDGSSVAAELKYAVSKISLKTTTTLPAGCVISLSGIKSYTRYNAKTGSGTSPSDYTATKTIETQIDGDSSNGSDVLSTYALRTNSMNTLTLSNSAAGEVQIPNVPLNPDNHTIIKGDVANIGLTTIAFTSTIRENWGSEQIYIEGLQIVTDDNGTTYYVSTPEALLAWASAVNAGSSQQGVGIDEKSSTELTQVDGATVTWESAMSAMNTALDGSGWEWVANTDETTKDNQPLIIQAK